MVILVAVILRSPYLVILLIECFVYEVFGLCCQLKPPCRGTTTGWRGHAGTATARGWRSTGAGRTWLASPPPTGWPAAAPTVWVCGPTATARPAGRSAPRTRQVSKDRISFGCSQFTCIPPPLSLSLVSLQHCCCQTPDKSAWSSTIGHLGKIELKTFRCNE